MTQRGKFISTSRSLLELLVNRWNKDRVPQLAAALSYYTIFSAAPLIIIIVTVAGIILGQDAVLNNLINRLAQVVGADSAATVRIIVENLSKPSTGIPASVLSIIAVMGGALGAFTQLRGALNQIWEAEPPPTIGIIKNVLKFLREQLISFVMLVGLGILVLLSLILSAILAALTNYVDSQVVSNTVLTASFWSIVNFLLTWVIFSLLFAAVYKFLPDRFIPWRDVWVGAGITSFLFSVGKLLIGLYLGRSGVTTVYGAAGSFVLLLLWVNYSAQVFFLGAELTHIYATKYGSLARSFAPKKQLHGTPQDVSVSTRS